MDTRQKTRPDRKQSRSRSTEQKKSGAAHRSAASGNKTRQPQRRSAAADPSAATQTRRSPQRPAGEQIRQRPPMRDVADRSAEAVAQEMVFKTDRPKHSRVLTPEETKRSAMRRRSAKRAKERKEENERSKRRPAVTYTQPKPFYLNHLLLQLSLVIAVVLAVVIGLSVFFRVDKVVVYGNNAYSAWTVQEASGIVKGDNLLTFGNPRACGKIMTALPYVKDVRIGIKLPDTVNIYIQEYDVAYAIATEDGTWWLMTSGGKVVEQIDSGIAASYTKIQGVELETPAPGAQAKAVEESVPVSTEQAPVDSTEPSSPVVLVTGADRLKAALLILNALEANDIVGEAASINVSSLQNIELQYGVRYLVKLGDTGNMEYKIASMKQAVAQLNDYQTGILDVSFTTWPDGPFYTPYA